MSTPEFNIDIRNSGYEKEITRLIEIRSKIADLQTEEKNLKSSIADMAEEKRRELLTENKIIGLIRLTKDDLLSIRIESRICNGTLDIDQEKDLDNVFGPLRPKFFEQDRVITAINDPSGALKKIEKTGKNPWDYFNLVPKKGLDNIISITCEESVTSVRALVPAKGLIGILKSVWKGLSDVAKKFMTEYLEETIKPTVVIGTRGKGV